MEKYDIGKMTLEEIGEIGVQEMVGYLWPLFYKEKYGVYLQFPEKLIPMAPEDFSWPICVPGIMPVDNIIHARGVSYRRTNPCLLDVSVRWRGRDAWTHSYIVRVRPGLGGDLENISGYVVERRGIDVITFRERLLLGQFVHWLSGSYLDSESVTLTPSLDSDGLIWGVNTHPDNEGEVVGVYGRNFIGKKLRFREAVSLPSAFFRSF